MREVISNDFAIAETFNRFFVNMNYTYPNLEISPEEIFETNVDDPVLQGINNFKYHSSIKMIKFKKKLKQFHPKKSPLPQEKKRKKEKKRKEKKRKT